MDGVKRSSQMPMKASNWSEWTPVKRIYEERPKAVIIFLTVITGLIAYFLFSRKTTIESIMKENPLAESDKGDADRLLNWATNVVEKLGCLDPNKQKVIDGKIKQGSVVLVPRSDGTRSIGVVLVIFLRNKATVLVLRSDGVGYKDIDLTELKLLG